MFLPASFNRHWATHLLALAALVVLTLARLPQAHAQEEPPSTEEQARILLLKGNLALRKGDDALAREHYKQSFELSASFDAVCNLGGAEARSGLHAEAYEHLLLCLHLYPSDPDLAEMKAKIEASRMESRVEISAEQAREAELRVAEYMEGRKNRGGAVESEQAPVPDAPAVDEPEPQRSRSARVPVSLGLSIVGVVGLGLGTGFHLKAAGHDRNAEKLRNEISDDEATCAGDERHENCADLQRQVEKTQSDRVVRSVGLATGGAFVVGAIVTYLLWPSAPDKSAAKVSPLISTGRTQLMLGVQGNF